MQRFFSADSIEMTPDEKYIKVCVELEKCILLPSTEAHVLKMFKVFFLHLCVDLSWRTYSITAVI